MLCRLRVAHLSVMKPLKLDGIGSAPAPAPLAVPSKHAPHINESPYWGALRATAATRTSREEAAGGQDTGGTKVAIELSSELLRRKGGTLTAHM